MRRGGWAFSLEPRKDELLSSFLVRNALAHGSTPYRFLNLFWPGQAVWNRDIDRQPPDEWLYDLARVSSIQPRRLHEASLLDIRSALSDDRNLPSGDTPLLLAVGVFHRTRKRHGLQYCPHCLQTTSACFIRPWRVGFVLHCNLHKTPLYDGCPHCDAPLIPHRVLSGRTDLCWRCNRDLASARGTPAAPLSDNVRRLEQNLAALLEATEPVGPVGPWWSRKAFAGVRTLLSMVAMPRVDHAVRTSFGMAVQSNQADDEQFEYDRWPKRAHALETVAAWTTDWPRRFREGAAAARLSRRSFARLSPPEPLASEIARLPEGVRRCRKYVPVIETKEMVRLRRKDKPRYRSERARLLFSACGRG